MLIVVLTQDTVDQKTINKINQQKITRIDQQVFVAANSFMNPFIYALKVCFHFIHSYLPIANFVTVVDIFINVETIA